MKKQDSGSEEDEPLMARKVKAAVKKERKPKVEPKKVVDKSKNKIKDEKQEEEDTGYKWWLDDERDEGIKWNTLEHSGPYFAPPYIPHGVRMKYDSEEIELTPEAEEVAGFFAAVLGTEWADNTTFQKNFFDGFKAILKKSGKVSFFFPSIHPFATWGLIIYLIVTYHRFRQVRPYAHGGLLRSFKRTEKAND